MNLHVPDHIESFPLTGTDCYLEWTLPDGNLRSLVYVFPHPVLPAATKAFFAGSFDLLVRRYEVGPDINAVRLCVDDPSRALHVVVLAQITADTLVWVSDAQQEAPIESAEVLGPLELADEGFNPSLMTTGTTTTGLRAFSTDEDRSATRVDTPALRPIGPKVVVSGQAMPIGSLTKPPPSRMRLGDERFDLQRELHLRTAEYLKNQKQNPPKD